MTKHELSRQPCVLGGTHDLTSPLLWIGTSCRKCHWVWVGTGLVRPGALVIIPPKTGTS